MPHQDFIVDGEKWPSATELTSLLPQSWIMAWYKASVRKAGWRGWQKCLAQTARGGRIGTEVHGLIEGFIKKEPIRVSGKYESEAFADALFDKINPLVQVWGPIEPHVVSNSLKIHGTADAIVGLKNREDCVILDWKTSAGKSLTHPIQLAIYVYCWNESNPDKQINTGLIARIDKKSKRRGVNLDFYENLEQYYPVIKALRVIWGYINA